MLKSNMLSIEAKNVLKEYNMLAGLKDFKPKENYKDREHFFADRIISISVNNINNKRKKKAELIGDRFSWRDAYNPYHSTMLNVRNYIIKELSNENTNELSK